MEKTLTERIIALMGDKEMEPQEFEACVYDEIMDTVRWGDPCCTVGYIYIAGETVAVRRVWDDSGQQAKAMLADLTIVDIGTRAENARSGWVNAAFVERILEGNK